MGHLVGNYPMTGQTSGRIATLEGTEPKNHGHHPRIINGTCTRRTGRDQRATGFQNPHHVALGDSDGRTLGGRKVPRRRRPPSPGSLTRMAAVGTDSRSYPTRKGANDRGMEIPLVLGFKLRKLLCPLYGDVHVMPPSSMWSPHLHRLPETMQNLSDRV